MSEQAEYLSERIEFEDEMVAMAPSDEARRIHEELAMHYRSKLALLNAEPAPRRKLSLRR